MDGLLEADIVERDAVDRRDARNRGHLLPCMAGAAEAGQREVNMARRRGFHRRAEGVGVRILHVAKRYWPLAGGVERYVHDLAAAQHRAGHRTTVLTIDRDVVGATRRRLPAAEVRD